MSNLDENELSQLASVLVALQRYDRFLPVGWNDSGTHDLIPVLDYWDADLLLGQIVYCPNGARFLFVPRTSQTKELSQC